MQDIQCKEMRKTSWQARTCPLVLTALLAWGGPVVPASAADHETATMALPVLSLTFSASYVAEDFGLWAKEGLNVKVVNIAGIGALNSVIAGSSEFANTTAGSFTRAAARGQKMLALANTLDRPMMEVVLRKDAGALDPSAPIEVRAKSLHGKTIAVDSINSITHGYLRIVAMKANLDPEKDIIVTPMQPPNMMAAMKSKSIDGFAMSQPWTLSVVLDGTASVVASSPRGDLPELVPFAYNLIVTRPETCEKRRSLCEKMGKGLAAAAKMIHERPDEVISKLQKRFEKLDHKTLATAFKLIQAATPKIPAITKVGLANAEHYNVMSGLIPAQEMVTNLDELFTTEFVR